MREPTEQHVKFSKLLNMTHVFTVFWNSVSDVWKFGRRRTIHRPTSVARNIDGDAYVPFVTATTRVEYDVARDTNKVIISPEDGRSYDRARTCAPAEGVENEKIKTLPATERVDERMLENRFFLVGGTTAPPFPYYIFQRTYFTSTRNNNKQYAPHTRNTIRTLGRSRCCAYELYRYYYHYCF